MDKNKKIKSLQTAIDHCREIEKWLNQINGNEGIPEESMEKQRKFIKPRHPEQMTPK
jgi:hypothetical protein